MAAETGQYDPWNAAVRSAAAAGGSWRADVRPAQSLTPGADEKKPQEQFAHLVDERVTKTAPADAPPEGGEDEAWLTVEDFIDIINPLQQLPVISTIYREFSGDEISPAARIAGGALYFWPFGAVGAAADAALEAATGDDLGGHVMALLDIGGDGGVETAEAAPEAAPAVSGASGAPDTAALPPEMMAALQRGNGGGVRPLQAEGFAFPQPPLSVSSSAPSPQKASAAYARGGGETGEAAEQQMRLAAEARALRRSAGEPGARTPPPGSAAADGGWFSAVMTDALNRYETAQDMARSRRQAAPGVDIEN